jgi:hypothetical protein
MSRYKFVVWTVSVLLAFLVACNMQAAPTTTSGATQAVVTTAPVVQVDTEVAQDVAGTVSAQTALANAVAATLAAMPTDTPEFTITPSLTFTPTFTFTPSIPKVSVSVQTNCRSGPGSVYGVLGYFGVGETAEVVGRTSSNDYWVIKLPSNPSITCWIWGQYAAVSGSTTGIPIINPPATPTLSNDFSVSFVDTTYCSPDYAFQFEVDNTGGITWESIKIVITNTTASTTTTHKLNRFRSYEGCSVESNQENLEPGEGGHVANINPGELDYDPAGDHFKAVFKLCSEDDLDGTCVEKTITFTP